MSRRRSSSAPRSAAVTGDASRFRSTARSGDRKWHMMNSAACCEASTVKSRRDGSSVSNLAGMSGTRRSVAGLFGLRIVEEAHQALASSRLTGEDHCRELTDEQSTTQSDYLRLNGLIDDKDRRSRGNRFHASCRGGAESDDATRAAALRSTHESRLSRQPPLLNETARSFIT